MCITDRHDMTLAVKVALNPNTTNQPSKLCFFSIFNGEIDICADFPFSYKVKSGRISIE